MKITRIEPIALTAPYAPRRTPPEKLWTEVRNCVWVRIDTDEGLSGWGEVYSGCYATEVTLAALRRFTRTLINQDPMDTQAVLQYMRFWNRYWAMRGIGAQSSSAIEAALWDIVGKVKKQPLWQLLGDGKPHPVLLYASDGDNRSSPEMIFEEVRFYVSQGYRAYKMRCGGDPGQEMEGRLALDKERVSAAREALGKDLLLFVDVIVPQRPITWEKGRAEAYMQALYPYNVRFIEEPALTYDLKRYSELQSLNLIPVAGGESFSCPEEFEPFLEKGAYGVVQPDAAVVGGPASCMEVCRRARAFSIPVCLHTWCAGVGIAQNLHVACGTEGVLAMEGPQMIHPPASEPLVNIWHFEDGHLVPPTQPGLGVNISNELLAKYPYQPDKELDY